MTFTDKISVNMGNNMAHKSKIILRYFLQYRFYRNNTK